MSHLISTKNALRLLLILLVVAFITAVHFGSSSRSGRPVRIVYAAEGGVVDVQIGDGGGSLVFTPAECQTVIGTHSPCSSTLQIRNVGGLLSVPFGYTIEAWADTDGLDSGAPGAEGDGYSDCFTVTLVAGSSPSGSRGNGPRVSQYRVTKLQLMAAEVWTVGVWVKDDNTCQGQAATVIVGVHASDTLLTATASPTLTATPTVEPTETPRPAFTPVAPFALTVSPLLTPEATPTEPNATAVPATPTPLVGPAAVATPEPVEEVLGVSHVGDNFLTERIPGISDVSTDVEVIATNMTLALASIVIILTATTVFNATLKENPVEIGALATRLRGRATRLVGTLGWHGDDDDEDVTPGWLSAALKSLGIVLITGLIYSALQPGFGLNGTTLVLLVSMMAGIGASTFLFEGGQILWSSRRYKVPAVMRIYPLAMVIAAVSVVLTKLADLHPGVVFGFVAAAAILPRTSMSSRQQGMIVLVPVLALLATACVSFLLIEPMRAYADAHASVWAALPETIAVALFVCGAQGSLLILIPVTFNDGEKIWAWNKLVWLAVALPASFMFFHVMVNSSSDFEGIAASTKPMVLLMFGFGVLVVSVGTWLYFRLRSHGRRLNPEQ